MSQPLDYKELLKKFICIVGEDDGQCRVRMVTDGDTSLVWSDEEKAELIRLNEESYQDWKNGKWEEV